MIVIRFFELIFTHSKKIHELEAVVLPILGSVQTKDLLDCYELWLASPDELLEALETYHNC